jgi:hypothetical protein
VGFDRIYKIIRHLHWGTLESDLHQREQLLSLELFRNKAEAGQRQMTP